MTEIHIHLKKQHLVIFISLIAIFGVVLVTNAYGSNQPDVMGHSAGELHVDFGGSTQDIQNVFNSITDDSGNINYANTAGSSDNANYADSAGSANSVDWNNINNRPSGLDDGDNIGELPCNWDGGRIIATENRCYSCSSGFPICIAYGPGKIYTRAYCSEGKITSFEVGDPEGSRCCISGTCGSTGF